MFCSKCGTRNEVSDQFCKGCGAPLNGNPMGQTIESTQWAQQGNNVGGQTPQQTQWTQPNNNQNINSNYMDNALNPNMKIWAILSVALPAVSILYYFFIGMSVIVAVIIASAGLQFANRGKFGDPKLAKIGKILNYCLIGLAIIMLVILLINNFSK